MNLAAWVNAYLCWNLMIAGAGFGLWLLARGNRRWLFLAASQELCFHYALLVVITLTALVAPFLPQPTVFEPFVKVWSAPSLKDFGALYAPHQTSGVIIAGDASKAVSLGGAAFTWVLVISLAAAIGLGFLARDIVVLRNIRRRSFCIRALGRVLVYVSDAVHVPFSYLLPFYPVRFIVVVPTDLAGSPALYLALKHELQHHRQGDTIWLYGFLSLKVFCGWNPLVHLWLRSLSECQEFACDEVLVRKQGVAPLDYARCLVQVAERALSARFEPGCATGLAFNIQHILKRRIEIMTNPLVAKQRKIFGLVVICGATLISASLAWSSQSWLADRRISLKEAETLATQTLASESISSDIPIVINDLVLKELNRYLGTSEGRKVIKNALTRMEAYSAVIAQKASDYGVPQEVLALPIIESAYVNRGPSSDHKEWGAGIWMFIEPTARRFGLRVEGTIDERLDVALESDAAMRLLVSGKAQFQNWELAILSFNIGESKMEEAIQTTQSHDVWTLIRAGFENDGGYYPRFLAALLIMKNPGMLDG